MKQELLNPFTVIIAFLFFLFACGQICPFLCSPVVPSILPVHACCLLMHFLSLDLSLIGTFQASFNYHLIFFISNWYEHGKIACVCVHILTIQWDRKSAQASDSVDQMNSSFSDDILEGQRFIHEKRISVCSACVMKSRKTSFSDSLQKLVATIRWVLV